MRASLTRLAPLLLVGACATSHGATPEYPPLASLKHDVAEGDLAVSVLLYETRFHFEEDGTYTRTVHQKYKLLSQEGVDGWGATEAAWLPGLAERPVVRASVFSPEGRESKLDPATLVESATYPDAPEMYGDARELRGPLPNVRVGSIVDEEIATHVRRPYLGSAESYTMTTEVGVPREKVLLVVDLPERLAIKYESRDATVTVSDAHRAGRRVITFAGGPYEGLKGLEPSVPSNVVGWPHVSFTTGSYWKPLATVYAKVVDDKIAHANLEDVARKIVQPTDTPIVKAEKLLAWTRERVRYVGIELSDSIAIPRSPKETLEHGYGDCKDQAVVLVALLRAAGVEARVALLDSGFQEDIEASLPALNVFNHAIVVVPGRSPIWIDPTATGVRAGELPTADQGRYALVADDGTEALTRTPSGSEKRNTYREVRQVFLPEYGPARIVETSTATGALEWQLRGGFDVSEAERSKWLKEYVSRTYQSKQPGRLELPRAGDLSSSFSMTVEAKEARVSNGGLLTESVNVTPSPVFASVPQSLAEGEERKAEFALSLPYESELVYEIHPDGDFVLDKNPDLSDVPMGPASLHRSVTARPDGVIQLTYRFVLPKSVWSAREVNEFRKAYDAFTSSSLPSLSLVHSGQKAHNARDYEKEVAIYRKELQERPKDGGVRMRFAQALVDLGFGTTARRMAAEAVAMSPDDAVLRGFHGYILSRDMLGRWKEPGWDQAAAVVAYREHQRLDPSSVYAAVHTANLLEYDAEGHRYAAGSHLDEAAAIFDRLEPDALRGYDEGKFFYNATFDLLRAGRYDDVHARVSKGDPKHVAWVPAIVSAGMLGGVNGALAEVARLSLPEDQRATTLEAATDIFVELRKYPEAVATLSLAATGSSDERVRHRLDELRNVVRLDVAKLPIAKPEDVLRKAWGLCMVKPPTLKADLAPLVSTRDVGADGTSFFSGYCTGLGSADLFDGRSAPEATADTVLSLWHFTTDGNDAVGYRVRGSAGAQNLAFFLEREGGSYKIRAASFVPASLGCEALSLHHQGRRDAAVQWLTWARELVTPVGGDDRLADIPFVKLWTDKRDDVAVGAAALCSGDSRPDQVVPDLKAARASASGDRVVSIDEAFTLLYSHGDHDAEFLAAAQDLEKEAPTSATAWSLLRMAFARLGRYQSLRDDAAARLARAPSDPIELADLADAEALLGHFREARALLERLIATGRAPGSAYNNHAWLSLYTGSVSEEDLGDALRAVNMDVAGKADPGRLNTLAAVEIVLGHVADARDHLVKALDGRKDRVPTDADWYVAGRIAERLGLPEDARAAYAKVGAPAKGRGEFTAAHLALARLRAMR